MTKTTYTDDLALELRLLDVPGTAIGDILAEVESHLAETGEDPERAFGPVKEYAVERARAAGIEPNGDADSHFLVRLFRGQWLNFLGGLLYTVVAANFLFSGIIALAMGRPEAAFGLPPWPSVIIGAVLLVFWGLWFFKISNADRIVDPRTGEEVRWDHKGRREQ